MKKILPSLLIIFIMSCIGFSCTIFRPCCNKTVAAPSVMSLLTGKQWQFDTLYYGYTKPGTGYIAYARGDNYNKEDRDNIRDIYWADGLAEYFDNSGVYSSTQWSFLNQDSTVLKLITPGGIIYARILELTPTRFVAYDSTNSALDIQGLKPLPVPERIKDSLIQVFNVTDATKKLAYDNYFKANFYKADTASRRQDSIVINYLNKKGDTLQTEIKRYGPGVTIDHKSICDSIYILYDSSLIFYNKQKQIEYSEFWRYAGIACISDLDGEGMGGGCCFHQQYSVPELSGRIRIAYNKKGKETLSILTNIEGRMMRYRSYYDKYGKRTDSTQESIEYYQFWDN